MGGMMMMGGGVMGGEGGQGYGKQNPYAYGTPQRLDPPTPRPNHPMRQAASLTLLSRCRQGAAAATPHVT